MLPNQGLEGCCAALGGLLGHLGVGGASWEASQKHLEYVLELAMGPSWGVYGKLLGRFRGVWGSPWRLSDRLECDLRY